MARKGPREGSLWWKCSAAGDQWQHPGCYQPENLGDVYPRCLLHTPARDYHHLEMKSLHEDA